MSSSQLDDDALAVLRSLVLHVTTGSPLSESERDTVSAMATQWGAEAPVITPPLIIESLDQNAQQLDCNAEPDLNLLQIGMAMWLISHIIRLSGNVDRKRRRIARELVEYFESRKHALGLDPERPILFQYLKHVPHLRAIEKSLFLGNAWLPALFLQSPPDLETQALDRIYQTSSQRLTLYKLCYWFAAASGRRNAGVIDILGHIRSELALDSDPRCLRIANAIVKATGSVAPALHAPARTQPIADILAQRVVDGTVDTAAAVSPKKLADAPVERLIKMIPDSDRLPALAIIFEVAARETQLSPSALLGIARLVDLLDPSEGDLTGMLLRHELDFGRRIRLPRVYSINYAKMHAKARSTPVPRRSA